MGGNISQGKAYVFCHSGTAWNEQAGFTASDGVAGDHFGCSVSINGSFAVVGADMKNVNGHTGQGKAYVFKHSGNAWSEQAELISSDGASNDNFGIVSISTSYVIVGAYRKNIGSNYYQGKVYFYKKNN